MINYKRSLYVFGGIHEVTYEKNDVFNFQIDLNKWIQIEKDTSRDVNFYNEFSEYKNDSIISPTRKNNLTLSNKTN